MLLPPNIKHIKSIGLLLFLIFFLIIDCVGQKNPYLINFETAQTAPARVSYASEDTVLLNGLPWKMPGVFIGTMTVNDFLIDNRSARFRLTDNTLGDPGYMEMLTDLPLGIESISFYTAMYGNEKGGKLLILYSVDSGINWIPAGDTISIDATKDSALFVSRTLSLHQAARIKIQKADMSDSRINVDNISISQYGTGRFVLIKGKNPEGDNIHPNLDSLEIYFDHPIAPAAGTISIYTPKGLAQSISTASSLLTFKDSMVIIKDVQLQPETHHHILISANAFWDTINQLYSLPITDTTFWTFTLGKKHISPEILPLKNLSENFLACNASQNLFGLFKAYNHLGKQEWQCDNEGHLDSFAISISGGFGKDLSSNNEDWLILRRPLDLSEMDHPILSFWQKAAFDGQVQRSVQISYNYSGSGNPNEDSVEWIALNIPGVDQKPDYNWTKIDGISLNTFKHQPFYLAFTYACSTDGAYKLFYDDIKISGSLNIQAIEEQTTIKILGIPTGRSVRLLVNAPYKEQVNVTVLDVTGRKLADENIVFNQGLHTYQLSLPNLNSGIYVLKLNGHKTMIFKKFFLKD